MISIMPSAVPSMKRWADRFGCVLLLSSRKRFKRANWAGRPEKDITGMNNHKDKGRVLVTGGTGVLGAYIIRELTEAGWTVRAIRRGDTLPAFIPAAVSEKVEWVTGDILDIIGLAN